MLAGEVLFSRDHVSYENTTSVVYYGYSQYHIDQSIRVKDMLLTEIPVLVYYRQNRFKFGAGFKFGYLISSNIEESKADQNNQIGLVDWTALKPQRFGIPIDAEYQLGEHYFIGCRYNFGLNDVFNQTRFIDRNNRFDIQFKMTLGQ